MMQLNFPTYNFKVKTEENVNYVFDIIRKKYVVCTPEEWVRQHLLHYLLTNLGYPASLVAVERGLELNGLRKRFDLLVFNNSGHPLLLAECKAPSVPLSRVTFEQIADYNRKFRVRHLLVTNGINHSMCTFENDFSAYAFVNEIPAWPPA